MHGSHAPPTCHADVAASPVSFLQDEACWCGSFTCTPHVLFLWQEVERLSAGEDVASAAPAPQPSTVSDTQRAVDVAELRAYLKVQQQSTPPAIIVKVTHVRLGQGLRGDW